jgi:hypothetical protein
VSAIGECCTAVGRITLQNDNQPFVARFQLYSSDAVGRFHVVKCDRYIVNPDR